MTMSTTVYVRQPVNPERLFRFMQSALSSEPQSDYHRPPGQPFLREDGSTYEPSDMATCGEWGNRIGQGLPAILEVGYGADGPLEVEHYDCQAEPEYCEHGPDDVHDVSELRQWEPFCLKVWFDTAYGYKQDNGATCGDLHAYLVATLAAWLAEQPGSPGFVWSNGETDIRRPSSRRPSWRPHRFPLGEPPRSLTTPRSFRGFGDGTGATTPAVRPGPTPLSGLPVAARPRRRRAAGPLRSPTSQPTP